MILVDTSVWVDHLRQGERRLAALLESNRVCCHPFVVGELACGNLRSRAEILSLLQQLPEATAAAHEEVLLFINVNRLMGRGIGYVDAHLIGGHRAHRICTAVDKGQAVAGTGGAAWLGVRREQLTAS
jgi:predicted nucleic acid-binding protein